MKKILILTVTAGNGHNSNAKAMKEHLHKLDNTAQIEIVDVLKQYSSKLNVWLADGGYSLAMQLLPKVYEKFYDLYKRKPAKKRYKCAAQGVAMSIVDGLYQKIYKFQPDVIYCTHFYPAIALTNLRLVYNIPAKVIVTSLDYVNSPFWEACIGVDYFCLPNADFVEENLREGFKKEQLLEYGISVKDQFFHGVDKKEARKLLKLDQNKFTIMIIFGGGQWKGGIKIFENLAKLADKDMQIIMINGKNKQDYDKIEKMKDNLPCKVENVGFTDKVDLYMDASDVVVTKGGGLGTTECINKLKPMIITSKVYGQERYNVEYLKRKNIALTFKNAKELKENIDKFKNDKGFYVSCTENLKQLRRNAIDDLSKFILAQPQADYSGFETKEKVKKEVNQARKLASKTSK